MEDGKLKDIKYAQGFKGTLMDSNARSWFMNDLPGPMSKRIIGECDGINVSWIYVGGHWSLFC